MKCPLFREVTRDNYGNPYDNSPDCLKEDCAWWDEPTERCLWQNVSEKLSFIYLELNEIKKSKGG